MTIMLDFQQKRKARSLMYNKITLIILSALVLIVLHSTWSVYQKKRVSEEMKNISSGYVEELRVRSEELKSKIDRLDTEVGVEEEIRSRFSVVKERENMVVVVPNEEEPVSTTSSSKGLWAKMRHFFSKKD